MLKHIGDRSILSGVLFSLALLSCATGANATSSPFSSLAISSTIDNSYVYSIGSGPQQSFSATGDVRLRLSSNEGGNLSELGVDLTSRLDGDSFYYLHNGYCVGTCFVSIVTTLTFTLTNTGADPLAVRWDSLITPGHLAQQGSNGSARYQFLVIQDPDSTSQVHASAVGTTWGWNDEFSNFPSAGLSGFQSAAYSDPGAGHHNAWSFADWSATALNLDLLTIAGNSSTTLIYFSTVIMESTADCTDLSDCDGVQVAFGDPRNTGSIGGRMAGPSAFSASDEPLIGREFDVYTTKGKIDQMFVEQGAELPDPLPSVTIPGYSGPSFRSPAPAALVPEPASWALLVLGFGVVGWSLRRTGRLAPRPITLLPG